jgi:hypothetical protein
VVLDTVPEALLTQMPLQAGQQLLDLATAPAAEIEAVLVALGLPAAAADWKAACAAQPPTPASEPAAIRRGELP